MTIAPLDLILLLGSVQGFILATLLWIAPKGNRLSNRLLAALIGSLSLMSLAVGIPIANQWISLAIDLFPFFLVMPIGPLIYFYTQSVLNPDFRLGRQERRHFYPVVLDVGAPLIGWLFFAGLGFGFLSQSEGPHWGRVMIEYNTYVDIPRWISVTTYLILSRNLLRRQWTPDKQLQSTTTSQVRWLWQFINAFLIFQTIWLLFMIPYVVPKLRGPLLDQLGWYPIYIPIAILIYWLGLKGYIRTRSETTEPQSAKATASPLSPQIVEQVIGLLTKAMQQDRLYLDPELTTDKLGHHTQLAPKLISAVLNQYLGKNFNSYVNEYRVDEVKQRLLNPAYEHLTMTGIALDSGFNSQATFQRTFKQWTGMSPSQFVAAHKNNTSQIPI